MQGGLPPHPVNLPQSFASTMLGAIRREDQAAGQLLGGQARCSQARAGAGWAAGAGGRKLSGLPLRRMPQGRRQGELHG